MSAGGQSFTIYIWSSCRYSCLELILQMTLLWNSKLVAYIVYICWEKPKISTSGNVVEEEKKWEVYSKYYSINCSQMKSRFMLIAGPNPTLWEFFNLFFFSHKKGLPAHKKLDPRTGVRKLLIKDHVVNIVPCKHIVLLLPLCSVVKKESSHIQFIITNMTVSVKLIHKIVVEWIW